MKFLDCIKLVSPLDVVVFTIETQEIIKKEKIDDCVPASYLLKQAEDLIQMGEFSTRNITYWNVSEGKKKEEVPDWNERLIKELTSSKMSVNVQELDNTKQVMSVSCEIYMLAGNCMQLGNELLKGVKCATVRTAFGQIAVEL